MVKNDDKKDIRYRFFSETFSSRSIWWHYMTIVVPQVIRRSQVALLLIEAGANTDT
jgi:hypothetical protein